MNPEEFAMAHQLPGTNLTGHHHITMGVGNPQEDFDFHTKVLGLKCVKRTLFYDGDVPIYHLYYGNDIGNEGTLLTTFPLSHLGVKGKRGSGQVSNVSLSVPPGALDFWASRLKDHGMEATENERFGEKHLDFVSPHDICLSIVEDSEDSRAPHSSGPVPAEMMIRGTHSVGVSTRDMEFMSEFLEIGWGSRVESDDKGMVRYAMGEGGSGTYTDFFIEPKRTPGSWAVGEGAIHHMAYNVPSTEAQKKIKGFLEGLGYTDCSDVKDRGYFDSVYVRTPSGALFEACCSHDPSFQCDEPLESLGTQLMMSPQVEQNKEETLAIIGKIEG